MIIGLTGTLGAGKGTVVDFFQRKGFKHFSVRGFLIKEIEKRGLLVNRDNMVLIANQLREMHSPSYIVEQLYEKAKEKAGDCVIESIRTTGEVEALKKKENFYLIAVDAEPEIRYSRILIRQSETDNISYDEFLENEKREMFSDEPNKQNLSSCIKMADFILNNDKSFDELYKQVEEIFKKIKERENIVLEIKPKTEFEKREVYQKILSGDKTEKRKDYISWDEYFMGVAMISAMRSKDPNSQVGACIVNEKNHIVATGYNGFPIGCSDDELPWKRDGEKLATKYIYVVHAEANAITNATVRLDNCKIYLAMHPCNECTKLIIQSGIKEVIYISDKYAHFDEYKAAKKMLKMAGVKTRQFIPKHKHLIIDFDKIN